MNTTLTDAVITLACVQPSIFKRMYQLRDGKNVVVTLWFPKWYSATGVLESSGQLWELRRISVWKGNIGIFRRDEEMPYATFSPNILGRQGTLELPNGERLQFVTSMWHRTFSWFDDSEAAVIQLAGANSMIRRGHVAMSERGAALMKKYPWLPIVLWWIAMRRAQQ